jgi:hypothetical protein
MMMVIKRNKTKSSPKTNKPKNVETPMEPQRWCRGYSTMDGQRCEGWFNITNWH